MTSALFSYLLCRSDGVNTHTQLLQGVKVSTFTKIISLIRLMLCSKIQTSLQDMQAAALILKAKYNLKLVLRV